MYVFIFISDTGYKAGCSRRDNDHAMYLTCFERTDRQAEGDKRRYASAAHSKI